LPWRRARVHTDIGEARNRLSQPDHFDVCHRDAQLYVYVTPHELLHACTIRLAIEFHRSVRSVKVIVVETARANMQITLVYARIYAGKETSSRSASDDVRKLDDPITPIVNAELLDSTCIPYRASAYRGRNLSHRFARAISVLRDRNVTCEIESRFS